MKIQKNLTAIIIAATILSVILYLSGVMSGLFANRIIKEETKRDISSFKEETMQDFVGLQTYVSFLDNNLKDMQLEQTFAETLTPEQMCNFSSISMNQLVEQLKFYWDKLPYRIEEYEKNNEITQEYLILKEQYSHLSIRTWILAKSQFEKCNMNVVHGLFFYSVDCENCVEQGEQIDRLNKMISANSSVLIMFPIDFNSEQSIVKNLKEYYKIHSTPSIILGDKVFQGRVYRAEELFRNSKKK